MCAFCEVFRCAGKDYGAAFVASFGTEVDDPVCCLDDVGVMLYDNDTVTAGNEVVKGLE